MKCPRCYERMKKGQAICPNCLLDMDDLVNGSNAKVDECRRFGRNDLIVYTTNIPKEVEKKRILLFAIFLGFFGVHNYIIKRYVKAIIQSIASVFVFLGMIFYGFMMKYLQFTIPVLGFIFVLIHIQDCIKIGINKYKYPIALDEKKR